MNFIHFDKLQEIWDAFGPYGLSTSNNPFELVFQFAGNRQIDGVLFNYIMEGFVVVPFEMLDNDDNTVWVYIVKPTEFLS